MTQGVYVSQYNLIDEVMTPDLPEKVVIYDSTLRDGEQMAGVAFTREQKLDIARALDAAKVPQIEAGFPSISSGEREVVREIVGEDLDAEILALSRIVRKDVDAAIDCGVDMVLLFVGTSELHLKHKLHRKCDDIVKCAVDIVDYALAHGLKVSFSTEDSTRTELGDLLRVSRAVEEAGAYRIGLTDTVGCIRPAGMRYLVEQVKETCASPVSVHCHNDFGLALANALAGVEAGAEAIATTVNGMGERAGNVPLEEAVVALKVLYGIDTGVDTTALTDLSRMVAGYSRVPVQRHKPLVGDNAFTHESGIHVAAILEHPGTYEPIPPWLVGGRQRLVLGKHTGRKGLVHILGSMGWEPSEEQIDTILSWLKEAAGERGFVEEGEFWQRVKEVTKGGA